MDVVLPDLEINKSVSQLEYQQDSIMINWTASDNIALDTVLFNVTNPLGAALISSGLTTGEITLQSNVLTLEGTYTINLWANDTFGNSKLVSDTFDVNYTLPNLTSNMTNIMDGLEINYTDNILFVEVDYTGFAYSCNVTMDADGLNTVGNSTYELGDVTGDTSINFTVNLTDLSNNYGENYTINVTTNCTDLNSSTVREISVVYDWALDNEFIDPTTDGVNSYDIGDYIRFTVVVKRDGDNFNLVGSPNVIYNLSNSANEIVSSENITIFRRVSTGKYYGKVMLTQAIRNLLYANDQYHVMSEAQLLSPTGGVLTQQSQADYDTYTATALTMSSDLYSYNLDNVSENTVDDLVVYTNNAVINWTGVELDLSDSNPLDLDDAVKLDNGFVYVNSIDYPGLNSTPYTYESFLVKIIMNNVDCSNGTLYYGDYTTKNNIINNGAVCGNSTCINQSCTNNILTYYVRGFSGFAYSGNETEVISGDDDSSLISSSRRSVIEAVPEEIVPTVDKEELIIPVQEVPEEPEVIETPQGVFEQGDVVLRVGGQDIEVTSFKKYQGEELDHIDIEININKGTSTKYVDYVDYLGRIEDAGIYILEVEEDKLKGNDYDVLIKIYYKGELVEEKELQLD